MTSGTVQQQVPPHSLEAERAILGAILISERVLPVAIVEEGLGPGHFYRDRHATVYAAMLALSDRSEPIDVLTVTEHLRATGKLDTAGGQAAVDELASAVPAVGAARQYARTVIKLAERRQIIQAGHMLISGGHEPDPQMVAEGERLLAQRSSRSANTTASWEVWGADVISYLENEQSPGWPWPWPKLNELLTGHPRGNGIRKGGETTAISAWTNHGKSPICDQILGHLGNLGVKAGLYCNEGNRQQRALRNVARETGISLDRLKSRQVAEKDWQRVLDAMERPVFDYTPCTGWTAEEIARDFRWKRYEAVAVDMFHYIPHGKHSDREGIEHNLDVLIDAAELADIHLFLVVHLNEERAKGIETPMPVLRDIRGSGMIKNRCANVLFFHREQQADPDSKAAIMLDEASVILAKVRYGNQGGEKGTFEGHRMRFIDQGGCG